MYIIYLLKCIYYILFVQANFNTAVHTWLNLSIKMDSIGQVRWLMRIISALWEIEAGGSQDWGSWGSRPAWPTWWNPVSTKNTKTSWTWWHTPVIPALWETEVGGSLEARNSRPTLPTWWNPVSTKNTKNQLSVVAGCCNSSYLGGQGKRIAWTQEAEFVVSQDFALYSRLGDRARLCLKKEKKKPGTHQTENLR